MQLKDSIDLVLRSQANLGASFYDLYFRSRPEVVELFQGVDMERQSAMLTMTVTLIGQRLTHRFPATELYLRHLGSQHRKRDIPPDAYPKWREVMMQALAAFHGSEWTPELEAEWRLAFDQAMALMFEGYEQHFGV